jgi:hypothetical protein
VSTTFRFLARPRPLRCCRGGGRSTPRWLVSSAYSRPRQSTRRTTAQSRRLCRLHQFSCRYKKSAARLGRHRPDASIGLRVYREPAFWSSPSFSPGFLIQKSLLEPGPPQPTNRSNNGQRCWTCFFAGSRLLDHPQTKLFLSESFDLNVRRSVIANLKALRGGALERHGSPFMGRPY